jgi:hypothetical protein
MPSSAMRLTLYQNDWAREPGIRCSSRSTPWPTCCRGCLAKRHGMGKGPALGPAELLHVGAVIAQWLRNQFVEMHDESAQGRLL